MATSEAVPFAKTGGLADVCTALACELARLGHEVVLFLPAYRSTLRSPVAFEPCGVEFDVPVGNRLVPGGLLRAQLPDSGVVVYLVDQPEFFDRNEFYRENGADYADNCARFTFFARATLEAIRLLDLQVDVLHCNDWQTGLIPAYLAIEYRHSRIYQSIATVLTIHNLAYQGLFPAAEMAVTGLDWKYLNWKQLEFWGKLNLLKAGLVFADALTTVSPRYAAEIQTPDQGCGLEGVLNERAADLTGILNGIDDNQWNPARDTLIAAPYDVTNWLSGKAHCKAALQEQLGLPREPRTPLVGLVGRLADQKGWDLVGKVLADWAGTEEVQWAILGRGEQPYHDLLGEMSRRYPQRVAARFEFSDALAHRIEAGADLFLMPSRYEPCGLNQMYSLNYGTVPVVRSTGGLADTIVDTNAESLANHSANGFRFDEYSAEELEATLRRAIEVYRNSPATWQQLVETGMRQDWSWRRSAQQYLELYERVVQRKLAAAE